VPEDTERSAPRPTPTHGPNTQGPSRELRYRIPFALRLSMWRVPVPLGACQSGVSTANIRRAKRTGSGALSMSLIRRLGGCRRFTPLWRATQNTVARKAIHPYSGLVAYPSTRAFRGLVISSFRSPPGGYCIPSELGPFGQTSRCALRARVRASYWGGRHQSEVIYLSQDTTGHGLALRVETTHPIFKKAHFEDPPKPPLWRENARIFGGFGPSPVLGGRPNALAQCQLRRVSNEGLNLTRPFPCSAKCTSCPPP